LRFLALSAAEFPGFTESDELDGKVSRGHGGRLLRL
jgi:hypothetical protein